MRGDSSVLVQHTLSSGPFNLLMRSACALVLLLLTRAAAEARIAARRNRVDEALRQARAAADELQALIGDPSDDGFCAIFDRVLRDGNWAGAAACAASRGADDRLSEGDKVEADYRGRGKFYPGKISRDRGDDTYDIDYDDGERETRVAKRLIRSKDGGGGDDKLREGDLVEARYRGREKYYKGKISRDRGDGTYDIAYDDGEREIRVAKRLIRKIGGGSDSLREGDKVEADYRELGKFYPGKISRDRGDDTYDISYEQKLEESDLRQHVDQLNVAKHEKPVNGWVQHPLRHRPRTRSICRPRHCFA